MKLPETLQKQRLATGLAIAIGTLGLTGCSLGEQKNYTNDRNVGEYHKGEYVYPNSNDDSRLQARCEGTALIVKRVRNLTADDQATWLNDPACADQTISASDDLASAIYEVSK